MRQKTAAGSASPRFVYTCDKCGRTIIPFRSQVPDPFARLQAFARRKRYDDKPEDVEEFLDWLILPEAEDPEHMPIPHVDDLSASDRRLIVRCPQHISDRALRRVGLKRNKAARRWQKAAKEADDRRYQGRENWHELMSPYPINGPFIEEVE